MNYNEMIAKMEQDYADNKNSLWLNDILKGKLALEPDHDLVNVVKGLGFKYADVKRRAIFEQLENAITPIVYGDILNTARDIIEAAVFEDNYEWMTDRWDDMDEMAKMTLTEELILFGKL